MFFDTSNSTGRGEQRARKLMGTSNSVTKQYCACGTPADIEHGCEVTYRALKKKAERLEIAAQIVAGFAANPAIFAHNEQCGWSLVNCKDCELAGYAVKLANELMIANGAIGVGGLTT
jgi:hypothetical protein